MGVTPLFAYLINEKERASEPLRRIAAEIVLEAIQCDAADRDNRARLKTVLEQSSPEVVREIEAILDQIESAELES
jgi:hypothetical protein